MSSEALPRPGTIVLTTYGVAVIISCNKDNASLKAKIWRHAGKSMASSATAYLHKSSVIKELPAAPGMTTTCEQKNEASDNNTILVHCYSTTNDEYTVSYISNEDDHMNLVTTLQEEKSSEDASTMTANKTENKPLHLFTLKSSQIHSAKCAKFYPLIDSLIERGNDAVSSAKSMVNDNAKLSELSEKISKSDVMHDGDKVISDGIVKISEVTEKVSTKIKTSIPNNEEVNEIYKMLKDEELTVLLSNGKERLEQLLSGGLKESTQNALKDMGLEISLDAEGSISSSIQQAQEKALSTLEELLSDNLYLTLDSVKDTLGDKFGTMIDSLSTAAKSDGVLEKILGDISEKTSEWQEITGKLLTTKSSSLFMEGAQRLQTRLGNILSPKQISLVEKSGADLTKAFTEGDVAVAKLKSIELGDSVRSRLFAAIELRSETQGGLDSIIAGALSQVGGESVSKMLEEFKESATSNSSKTHESLISLLSERSQYNDIAISKIEQVLVGIESHIGDEMTPEEITALANGETGTAALFEPVAKRAAKEIEKQLDVAEESIEDERILAVISRVRKIMSGSLTLSSLVGEITDILDSEDAVQAGTILARTSEQILDVFEGSPSKKSALNDVIGAVEKAGYTKESVLSQLENLSMDNVLDTAQEAVSDEKKRLELLSSATDSALEFLLKILPSMPVPPFEGVRDGLIYSIKNLSMHGFKLRKEDIMVEIAGIRAAGNDSTHEYIQREVKASDILVVDIRNISANFENALWSFEQTYMPYLKGNGRTNVEVSDGTIRLEFELKKRQRKTADGISWEPVLCLKTRLCSIENLSITFEGGSRLTRVFTMLAKMLRKPLRDYVVRTIIDLLGYRSGWLLENLNNILSTHWDIIMKTTKLNIDNLAVVNKNDIVAIVEDEYANEVDLVWTEFVPLGINLLLNDKSGQIKVVDFPRGSQARKVCIDKELDPDDFKNAKIIAVNGSKCANKERVDIMLALRDPARPKTIKFLLEAKEKPQQEETVKKDIESIHAYTPTENTASTILHITKDGPIGIKFAKSADDAALTFVEFSSDGSSKDVESAENIHVSDILTHVNGTSVVGDVGKAYACLEEMGNVRPLELRFTRSYIHTFSFKTRDEHGDLMIGGPSEFKLEEYQDKSSSKICIQGYKKVDGCVESRGIFLGDHLIFINGMPVGTGLRLNPGGPELNIKEIYALLQDPSQYPMCLSFARPRSNNRTVEFDTDSLDTRNMSVIAVNPAQLGFELGQGASEKQYVVKKFRPVHGSLQLAIEESFGSSATTGLSFFSINGERIPSYANCDLLYNVLKRKWNNSPDLEIVLCNEAMKRKILTA